MRLKAIEHSRQFGDKTCPVCLGLGFFFDPSAARNDRGGYEICECIRGLCRCGGTFPYQYYDAQANAIMPCPTRGARMALDQIKIIEGKNGIPPRYHHKFLESVEFDSHSPAGISLMSALDFAVDAVNQYGRPESVRRGLYINGPTGCGKTLLACVILNELVRLYRVPVRYAKISRDVLGKLRSTFNPASPSYGEGRQIEEELGRVPVLVIDDFGVHRESEWVNTVLYDLIDARYENNLLTILTSNEPLADLKDVFGGRLYSRLVSLCREIQIDAPDFRLKENG